MKTAAVCLLLLAAGLAAGEQAPYRTLAPAEQARVLAELSERLGKMDTLQASFMQERHVAIFRDTLRSSGVLYFEAPDRLRWELREPYVSVSILNGKQAAKFDAEEGRLNRMTGMESLMNQVLTRIVAIMRGDFRDIEKQFRITVDRGPDYLLRMSPLQPEMEDVIRSLDIRVDPGLSRVTQVVIREPHGDSTQIDFSEEKENISVNPGLFDISKPMPPE
jgi:outer membrane lipoprotein carrier protein